MKTISDIIKAGDKQMLEQYIEELGKEFELTQADTKEYSSFQVKGMNFEVKAYDAKGLGRISLMEAKTPLAIMEMDSLIINPFEKDVPLFSIDRVKTLGKPILYIEMYDTLLKEKRNEAEFLEIRRQYDDIRNAKYENGNWCKDICYSSVVAKRGRKKDYERLNSLMDSYFDVYLKQCKEAKDCDRNEKKKKADAYRDGLLKNGGAATDNFIKSLGREKTEAFFRQVLFG